MQIDLWEPKLRDFLDRVDSGEIDVDESYQRSGKVWPNRAKSYLVETVILRLLLPPMLAYEPRGRRTFPTTLIIDGQQRTRALQEFRKNKWALSGDLDRETLRGKRYRQLSPREKERFDNYSLRVECIRDAAARDIRDIFRRINSYTAPLRPAERRHAKFQGAFKWFVYNESKKYADNLKTSQVLTEASIVRMDDAKLLSEIIHGMTYGITTTDARALDKLYRTFDREFDLKIDYEDRLSTGFSFYRELLPLPEPLRKHYHAYSLLLAVIHSQRAVPTLESVSRGGGRTIRISWASRNLAELAEALTWPPDHPASALDPFIAASAEGTNVKFARATRFEWFFKALTTRRVI